MKKLIILSFSFALLTACGGPPSLEDRIAESQNGEEMAYSYNGIIEPLELDVYQQGTHQIRTDDDELIIIQSQKYDLNKYLEKRVILSGTEAKIIGDAEPVLNVTEIELEDGELSDELQTYEDRLFGLKFSYPNIWGLAEASGDISLSKGDDEWVSIEIFSDKSDLDAFANAQESGDGTPVTIASQRSLRYINSSSIRMYIPNPPKKKIYRVTFEEVGSDADTQKEYFYDLLESFELIYLSIRTGEKCGGEEGLQCLENYRCELESDEENAEGICVSLDLEGSEQDCPYIAPPAGCRDYRVSDYSKSGCPARYECVENGEELRIDEEESALDTEALIGTIEKYQDQILHVEGASITQYEISEEENLIAIVYEDEDKEYKTLYSFAPSANEFNFIEKAHWEDDEDGNLELVSGGDLQRDLSVTIIKAKSSGGMREVSSDMNLYENTHKDFSLEYPKNWYYQSFGAINDTRWIVGFADEEVDNLSDAIITVSILDEEPASTLSNYYYTVRDRDDDTVYVVEGPEDYQDIIDAMADSIQ
ncbi:hypothetical protein KJ742_06535 [Patescibacteria group bacterium]|nr:hypothetical protein [Patescibacteria group bacterium]MBU1683569.1 hypothetical protein [Patescibacteria group bacterium]MBU1934614.1 hypothetical protein [Patescibacteria group bacterium]